MVQLYNFATYIHIKKFSFTDLNESMNYVHKNMLTAVRIWTVIHAASVVEFIVVFSAETLFFSKV